MAFLQRLAGYSAIGICVEHKLIILWGSGRNGKSTFTEIIRDVLGDYVCGLPVEALLTKFGDRIPTDIASLKGKRVAFASESPEGKELDEPAVKSLTGGDTLTARHMRQDFFDFRPTHQLWLTTNHRPAVRETTTAIWSRLLLVPFTRSFAEDADLDLLEKLRGEGSGILGWIVEGARAWQQQGLNPPEAVRAAVTEYRSAEDTLANFLEQHCAQQEGAEVSSAALYHAFTRWCDQTGEDVCSQRRLGTMLAERGYKQGRRARTRFWRGIELVDGVTQ